MIKTFGSVKKAFTLKPNKMVYSIRKMELTAVAASTILCQETNYRGPLIYLYVSFIDFNIRIWRKKHLHNYKCGFFHSITASSSLSSGELLTTPPRPPSSPSVASLRVKLEPITVEMSGKSNSAPLLENNGVQTREEKTPVRKTYNFISEGLQTRFSD